MLCVVEAWINNLTGPFSPGPGAESVSGPPGLIRTDQEETEMDHKEIQKDHKEM